MVGFCLDGICGSLPPPNLSYHKRISFHLRSPVPTELQDDMECRAFEVLLCEGSDGCAELRGAQRTELDGRNVAKLLIGGSVGSVSFGDETKHTDLWSFEKQHFNGFMGLSEVKGSL